MNTREILHSSASNTWQTPPEYLEAARAVMGGIDLDPASDYQANQTVKAARYYSAEHNGLLYPWCAERVFLNPPYGYILDERGKRQPGQRLFTNKLIAEHEAGRVTQAVLLVNAATGDQWFQPLWAYPICFCAHRIAFIAPDRGKRDQPTHSNVFVYLGPNTAAFARVFGVFGPVVGVTVPIVR